MTIRIIVRVDDANALAHGAASNAEVTFKTFDVDLPAVETFLRGDKRLNEFVTRSVIGVELLEPPALGDTLKAEKP